jgi:hypothetical protein
MIGSQDLVIPAIEVLDKAVHALSVVSIFEGILIDKGEGLLMMVTVCGRDGNGHNFVLYKGRMEAYNNSMGVVHFLVRKQLEIGVNTGVEKPVQP